MGSEQLVCLRWNNHSANLMVAFDQLLKSESLVDVTLACDGYTMRAHKLVLSACSPYFHGVFMDNTCKHPVVILKEVNAFELQTLIDFMYKGEMNVTQEQLVSILKVANFLKISGLKEMTREQFEMTSGRRTRTVMGNSPNVYHNNVPKAKQNPARCQIANPSLSLQNVSENTLDFQKPSEEGQVDLRDNDEMVENNGVIGDNIDVDRQQIDEEEISGVNMNRNDLDITDRQCLSQSSCYKNKREKDIDLPPLPSLLDQSKIIARQLSDIQMVPSLHALQHHHPMYRHCQPSSLSQNFLMPVPNSETNPFTSTAQIHLVHDAGLSSHPFRSVLANLPQRCRICRKVSSNTKNFYEHMKIHAQVKKWYNCHVCTRVYSRFAYLSKHLTTIHGIPLPLKQLQSLADLR